MVSVAFDGRARGRLRIRMREAELVRGEPAGSAFTFCAHSRHDALSSMFLGAAWSYTRTWSRNLPPKQRARRHAQDASRQIPQRHLDTAERRASDCAPTVRPLAQPLIDGVDLQRVLADDFRFQGRICSFTPAPGLPYASPMPNSPASLTTFTSV